MAMLRDDRFHGAPSKLGGTGRPGTGSHDLGLSRGLNVPGRDDDT